jgi:hypothetical protein
MSSPPPPLAEDLRHLHEAYIDKVNAAVAAGQANLATELSDRYVDDAGQMILAASPRHG